MEYLCGGGKGRAPETCRHVFDNMETCYQIHETMKLVHINMIYV